MYRFINSFIVLLMSIGTLAAVEVSSLAEAKSLAAEINKPILIEFMTET